MGSVESESQGGTALVDATNEQPVDRDDTADSRVSWETEAPNWNRLRSVGLGGLLGIAGVGILLALPKLPAIVASVSVDLVLSVGLLLFVVTPFAVHARSWAEHAIDRENHSLR